MHRSRPLILIAVLAAAARPAAARWTDYLPKPFENGGYVELLGSHEREDASGGPVPFGWKDTFFKEEVNVFSNGYVYHPRFLRYQLSLSGALKQEDYETTDVDGPGWQSSTGFEYDTRLTFLPEHPYNFELFAIRREPLYVEHAATLHNSVETNKGAQFRYRRKPFFAHVGYLDSGTKSTFVDSHVKRFGADGQYYKLYAHGHELSVNAAYNDSHFTGNGGLSGTLVDYAAGGFFDVKPARFNASVTKSESRDDSLVSGHIVNDRFSTHELLTLYLPLRFRTDLSYRVLDNTSTTPTAGGAGNVERTELSKQIQFELSHRLYESLDSRYTFMRDARESSAGDSTLRSHTLDFDYAKRIPRGRVLAGVLLGRSTSDNGGRTDVVGEVHAATAVPGSFTLRQPNAQPGTVDISLPSTLPPFPMIHLVENVDFTVTPLGNTLEINVVTLPPQFVVPGTYDLTVTYSLVTGEFTLSTDSYAVNASVPLLDNLVTPYLDFVAVRSDVTAGTFPGTSLDSTTTTVGVTLQDGPWHALVELRSLDWDVNPYKSIRLEVQYVSSVATDTRLFATGSFLRRHFSSGNSSQFSEPFTDQTATINGSVQQELFSRALMVSAGASYSLQQGQVDGHSYALSASLNWKIGKLDCSAGANAYGSDSQAATFERFTRDHQYYYFRVRRRF